VERYLDHTRRWILGACGCLRTSCGLSADFARSSDHAAASAVFSFGLAVLWTLIAAAQKAVEDRWLHWTLAVVWFGSSIASLVRARRAPLLLPPETRAPD
jgi:uncharacterized protein (DUF983 family)